MMTPDKVDRNFVDPQPIIELSMVQTSGNMDSALALLGLAIQSRTLLPLAQSYDIEDDFKWFTSGELDTSSFKGKYIAIWKKQVVASGDDATEVENIAKWYCGKESRPAVVYIPEDENAIL
jgi:hypothetical protein